MNEIPKNIYLNYINDVSLNSIKNQEEFINSCLKIYDKVKLIDFSHIEYEEEIDFIYLFLSTYRKVWVEIKEKVPNILDTTVFEFEFESDVNKIKKKRLSLFKHSLNSDDFIEHFNKKIKETSKCLENFINLDREVEHLTLIATDYISFKLSKVLEMDKYELDAKIRDVKIGTLFDNK